MSPEQSGRGRLAEVPWRTLTTRVAYRNPWIRIDEDQVEMPDGRTTLYGVVRCGECVGILPFLDPEMTRPKNRTVTNTVRNGTTAPE